MLGFSLPYWGSIWGKAKLSSSEWVLQSPFQDSVVLNPTTLLTSPWHMPHGSAYQTQSAPALWASWIWAWGVEKGFLIHWGLTLLQLGSPLNILFVWEKASKEFIKMFKKTIRPQAIIHWHLTAFLSLKNFINNDRQTCQVSLES